MNIIVHRVRKLIEAAGFLRKLSAKTVFELLKIAAEPAPQVVVNQTAFGSFCGLENDYLYQCALTQGSNEPHFDQIV